MSGWSLDISEYADICRYMLKSVWMAFALYFSVVIPCPLEHMLTYFSVYTKLEVLVLRKNDTVLLETQKLIFSIIAVILFGFYFRLNFLQVRFQICCYLWGPRVSLLLLVAFLLKHNVDEKSMRNFDVIIHVRLEVKVSIFWTHPHLHPLLPTNTYTHTHTHTHSHTNKLPAQTFRNSQKILTQGENFDPRKKNWHTQKNLIHATHVKIMTHVKNILTHITHVTHVKIWPTPPTHPRAHTLPTDPRNPHYHAAHAI